MQINGNAPAYRGTAPLAPTATAPTGEPPTAPTEPMATRPAGETPAELGTKNLSNALVATFGSMSPPVQALFDVMTGGLTQKSYQAMLAKGVTVDMLQQAGLAFAPMLLGFQPVGQIMGSGALSWLKQAKSLEDLLKTPENEAKAGQAMVDQLAGVIFPGPSNALLRQGASELLTQGALDPLTAQQLGSSGLRTLGETLGKFRDLILEVAPGETGPQLNSMLYAVGIAASAERPTGQSLNAAAQNALPAGMQQATGTPATPKGSQPATSASDGSIETFTAGSVENWANTPGQTASGSAPTESGVPLATVRPGSNSPSTPTSSSPTSFGGSVSTSGSVSGTIEGVPGGANYSLSGNASANYGGSVYSEGSAGIDENGLHAEGRIGAEIHAGVEANAHGEFNTGISHTTVDAHVDASVEARAEAGGAIRVDGNGVHAEGHVGAEVHAEVNANADMATSLFGGAITDTTHVEAHAEAEASAEASARVNVGFDEDGDFELDLGFDAHASASVEAAAKGQRTINIFGFTIGVEGYAAAQAGVEAGVSGWLSYKDGQLHIGGSIGAALGIGVEYGGGIVIGLPPFMQDVVNGAAKLVGGVVGGIGDAVKGIGDFFGGLFGGGGAGADGAAAQPAMPSAPAWSLSDLGDWMEDLANGGTSASTAMA